jgi:hypothetical protein
MSIIILMNLKKISIKSSLIKVLMKYCKIFKKKICSKELKKINNFSIKLNKIII